VLTQAVCHAARALSYLASHGREAVLVRDLADRTGIPGPYLAKIVNQLSRKGLVQTQRGVGGGVAPLRDPATLTLYDLCVALGDPIVETRCLLANATCSDERACPAHGFFVGHREKELEFLRSTTLADLAAFEADQERRAKQTA